MFEGEKMLIPKKPALHDPKNFEDLTSRYELYLDEMVDRLWVVIKTTQAIQTNQVINEYRSVDIDLCYLQIRKAFELIAFSSLLAHRLINRKISKNILTEYHALKIIAYVKKFNPTYFPKPVMQKLADGKVEFVERSGDLGVECLCETEYKNAYKKVCGYHLHANHSYEKDADSYFEEHAKFLNQCAKKTMALMGNHTVNMQNEFILYGCLNVNGTGKPYAKIARRVRA
jgi:hypothetical protein